MNIPQLTISSFLSHSLMDLLVYWGPPLLTILIFLKDSLIQCRIYSSINDCNRFIPWARNPPQMITFPPTWFTGALKFFVFSLPWKKSCIIVAKQLYLFTLCTARNPKRSLHILHVHIKTIALFCSSFWTAKAFSWHIYVCILFQTVNSLWHQHCTSYLQILCSLLLNWPFFLNNM